MPEPGSGPARCGRAARPSARVLDLLEVLPINQREVIRLKFQNGFSYQEISRISGHSVSNVGYLIHAGVEAFEFSCSPAKQPSPAPIERRAYHEHRPQRPPVDRFRARRARSDRTCGVEALVIESADCRQAVEEIRLTRNGLPSSFTKRAGRTGTWRQVLPWS